MRDDKSFHGRSYQSPPIISFNPVVPVPFTPWGFGAGDGTEKRPERSRVAILPTRITAVPAAATECGGGVVSSGGSGAFSKNGADFFSFQTRAGTGTALSGLSMSFDGMSGSGAGMGEGTWKTGIVGSGGSTSGACGNGEGEQGGVVVGAEGAFPVAIGFVRERNGANEVDWVEGGVYNEEGGSVCDSYQTETTLGDIEPEAATMAEYSVDDDRREQQAASVAAGDEGSLKAEKAVKFGGLGSWAADFGLCLADDGQQAIGKVHENRSNGVALANDFLPGWGFVQWEEEEEARVVFMPREEAMGPVDEAGGGGRQGMPMRTVALQGTGVERPGAGSQMSIAEPASEARYRQASGPTQGGTAERWTETPVGEATTTNTTTTTITTAGAFTHTKDDSLSETALHDVASIISATDTELEGETDIDSAEATAENAGESTANAPFATGFFDALRRLAGGSGISGGGVRGERGTVDELQAAIRTAGGELYGLGDRLAVLSAAIRRRPLISNGRGGQSVAAAEGALSSVRDVLRLAVNGTKSLEATMKPGQVRRAAEVAKRCVREAERVVEVDTALLDDAGVWYSWFSR